MSEGETSVVDTMEIMYAGYDFGYARQTLPYAKLSANQELIGVYGYISDNKWMSCFGFIVKEQVNE